MPWREPIENTVADDVEPPEVYYRQRATAIAYQLQHETPSDPELRARLERELAQWRSAVTSATIKDHWDGGDGDRRLF